jgi:hypothetical protein
MVNGIDIICFIVVIVNCFLHKPGMTKSSNSNFPGYPALVQMLHNYNLAEQTVLLSSICDISAAIHKDKSSGTKATCQKRVAVPAFCNCEYDELSLHFYR